MLKRSIIKMFQSVLKRWQNIPAAGHSYITLSSDCDTFPDYVNDLREDNPPNFAETGPSSLVHANDHKVDEAPEGCTAVYVGNSRRRYFISAEKLNNPLLGVMMTERFKDGFSVPCEVVMFEYLVWMLENSNPEAIKRDSSFEEFVQFYVSD